MDDAGAVRGVERASNVGTERNRVSGRQRARFETRLERLSGHILHDDVGAALWGDASLVYGADALVVQGRRGPSLKNEPMCDIASGVVEDDFDGHLTPESGSAAR